jgi:hypothetical protein
VINFKSKKNKENQSKKLLLIDSSNSNIIF